MLKQKHFIYLSLKNCLDNILQCNVFYLIWLKGLQLKPCTAVGGAVASWLVRSTPDLAVRVRALTGDIVLCSWARHFTLSASLHPGV